MRAPHPTDVVSFHDVLEHLFDPVGTLRTAARALRPNGLVVVEVPDLDQADDFRSWKHRRIGEGFTEHVWHFTAKALAGIQARHLPHFTLTKTDVPVAGKLRVVWRKPGVVYAPGTAGCVSFQDEVRQKIAEQEYARAEQEKIAAEMGTVGSLFTKAG
jgi:SAM-dependent methyltransferase